MRKRAYGWWVVMLVLVNLLWYAYASRYDRMLAARFELILKLEDRR